MIMFRNPNTKNVFSYGVYPDDNGVFRATINVPEHTNQGNYIIEWVAAIDGAGNTGTYYGTGAEEYSSAEKQALSHAYLLDS